jgi:hypothetical protein
MRTVSLLAGVSLVLGAAGIGAAQEPSGNTVGVIPAASASGVTGARTLAVDDPIFMGDEVNTDGMGEVQIRFRDDTRIVVGPNSLLTIDRFVFNPDNTAQDVSLNYVRGTFRFIGGFSRPEAYTARTPSMTIGIRGTEYDIWAGGLFLLIEDGATLCHRGTNQCVEVDEPCSLVVANDTTIRVVEAETEKLARLRAAQQTGQLQYVSEGDQRTLLPEHFEDIEGLCGLVIAQGPGSPAATAALAQLGIVVLGAAAGDSDNERPVSP